MKNRHSLNSLINYVGSTILKLSTSPTERLDEFISSYFIKKTNGVYKYKTIKIETKKNEIVDIPIINLLPLNIMFMKKANVKINGDRVRCKVNNGNALHQKTPGEIIVSEEGDIGISIDFESALPTEGLMRILEKNI